VTENNAKWRGNGSQPSHLETGEDLPDSRGAPESPRKTRADHGDDEVVGQQWGGWTGEEEPGTCFNTTSRWVGM
jgi:hypothetical protein